MLANSRKYFAPPLPERKSERRKVLIDQARLLNQAKGWGAPRIKNVFDNAFGPDMEWGQRSVSTWIGKSSIEPELDQYWRPWNSRSKTDDAGHLMRLDLVKRSATMYRLLDVMGLFATAGLTESEADIAMKLRYSLHPLDPIVQLLIVHEYAQRFSADENALTSDLDLLVATQPWLGGDLYKYSLLNNVAPPVEIRGLNTYGQLPSDDPMIRVQVWAWDALKVPWLQVIEVALRRTSGRLISRLEPDGLSDQEKHALATDRSTFNWEWLIMNGDALLDDYFNGMDLESMESEVISNDRPIVNAYRSLLDARRSAYSQEIKTEESSEPE